MAKYRTIQQAFECIKALDADTAITYHALRQLAVSAQIPSMRIGKKYVIDLDVLAAFMGKQVSQDHPLDFTPVLSDL